MPARYIGPRSEGQIRTPEKIVFKKGEWMEVTIEVINELKNNSEFEINNLKDKILIKTIGKNTK